MIGKLAVLQRPWARGADRLHEIANRSSKVHSVASQAVVHQKVFLIEGLVKKNVLIRNAMRAAPPVGILLLMAPLAIGNNLGNVSLPDENLIGHAASQVGENAPHVVQMESGIEGEDVPMTFCALDISVRGGVPIRVRLPDLVTPCAGSATACLVVQARSWEEKNNEQADTKR
jgi:hypothetical protein